MTENVSAIGFEGFEKRLEITFHDPPVFTDPTASGLRSLLRSIGLTVSSVVYSRGCFNFPNAQFAPHRSFSEEVSYLNGYFSDLASGSHAYVLGDPTAENRSWHVYSASNVEKRRDEITLEICMTGLKKENADVFYKKDGHLAKEMTKVSGISDVIPSHVICDFEFDPCGFSMNGIDGGAYSTIHVTPEDGFSYASYEAMGFDPSLVKFKPLVKRVLKCFEPKEFTVAFTCFGGGLACEWISGSGADVDGFECRSAVKQELPGGEFVVYKTYVVDKLAREVHASFPLLALPCWREVEEANDGGEMVACGGEMAAYGAGSGGFLGLNFVPPV
ncbi:S-adenosylmethionine decarboxylase proenzyme [Bienertia sinuspersici]